MISPKSTSKQRYQDFLARRNESPTVGAARSGLARAAKQGYLRRYVAWLRPELRALILVLGTAVVGIAIDMTWPLVSAYVIDSVVLGRTLTVDAKVRLLGVTAAVMALLFFTNSALNWVRSLRLQLLTSRLAFSLRSRLFDRILHLPLAAISDMKTGGILSRLSRDVDHTTTLVQQALVSPTLALLRLMVTLAIIFTLNVRIATAVMLAIPPILLVQHLWARRIRTIWRSMGQDRQEIDGRVSEGITGIRIVRGFRREGKEAQAYAVGHHTVIRKQMLATRTQRSVGMIWDLIMPMTQLTIVGYGGYLVIRGNATIGTLVAFQGYIWRLLEPIMQIATSISETQRGLAAMERVFDVLDQPEDKPDLPDALPAPRHVESIQFDHVGFEYREGIPVLHDFDLRVSGGSVVALVGPSGAGKTTVTDLVARFIDPTSGTLRVNGVDIRQFELKTYRGLLGIVAQDVFLFDGSVRDNIAYARSNASLDEIRDAARRANAEEFILRLPEGYQTLIGERGVKLSGGQRQRISIARAILANPRILIMDEATSNLDTESEQLIQASMRELLAGRTTFLVAHRLSTITHADVIIVLEAGHVREQGTHASLMARGGMYREMIERQAHAPAGRRLIDGWASSAPRA